MAINSRKLKETVVRSEDQEDWRQHHRDIKRDNRERRLRWDIPQVEKLLHLVKKWKHGFEEERRQRRKEKLFWRRRFRGQRAMQWRGETGNRRLQEWGDKERREGQIQMTWCITETVQLLWCLSSRRWWTSQAIYNCCLLAFSAVNSERRSWHRH